MDKKTVVYVILKRFGTIEVNEEVPGHKHANGLWHVLYSGEWHEVPEEDIIPLE